MIDPAAPPSPVAPGTPPGPDAIRDALNASGRGELAERMGIVFLEAAPGRVVARMPVEGNRQPFGLLHGGASGVLAETVGSVAATLHAAPAGFAVGLELSCTHHRSARAGHVTATATALSEGRTVASYDIAIVDDEGRRVCTARLTCVIRPAG